MLNVNRQRLRSRNIGPIHTEEEHSEMDLAEKSMDKNRDDEYLLAENCVTKPINKIEKNKMLKIKNKSPMEEKFYESTLDGYNNAARHSADYTGLNSKIERMENVYGLITPDEFPTNQVPDPKDEDIKERRSNSSASTTSHSALSSSEVLS